jgi:2-phosphosulfolactate phosphatase
LSLNRRFRRFRRCRLFEQGFEASMHTRRLFLNRLDPGQHEPEDAVVVIDVLRSFSTAAYALAAGASTIYPVETISAAFHLQRALPTL